jgi:hypothetical protein
MGHTRTAVVELLDSFITLLLSPPSAVVKLFDLVVALLAPPSCSLHQTML